MIITTNEIEKFKNEYENGISSYYHSLFYRKRIGYRKSGIIVSLTDYEQKEYQKCKNDIFYFIEKYCLIRDLQTGEITNFKLRDYQKEFIQNYIDNRFNVIKNSRQTGISTLLSLIMLHRFNFSIENTILTTSSNRDSALENLEKVKKFYSRLPFFLQAGVQENNQSKFVSEYGSRIIAEPITKTTGMGFGINELFSDEFAYSGKVTENFYQSIFPLMSAKKDTKIVISSTPNGHNHFYKLYQDAAENKNAFKPSSINCWDVPGRDENWKKKMINNLGSEEYFRQEFLGEFIQK